MDLTRENKNTEKIMQAQTLLWSHIFNHIDSMSLKCAVELGIPQAIHDHGKPITVNELISSLSISPAKMPQMFRLMRMLSHSGIFMRFRSTEEAEEDTYSLTPMSSLLVANDTLCLSDFLLAMLHPLVVNPFQSMSTWFRSDNDRTAFHTCNGCGIWEMTENNTKFNKVFNEGLVSDSKYVMEVLMKEHGHVLDGVKSLVDVGGGTGSAAISISEAFPEISCSVLDLPQVVNTIKDEEKKGVNFISGDMFDYIPPADVIMLKWILHDWNDEECVKILKRCKEAIVLNNNEGKVIIIDQVVDSNNSLEKSREAQLYFDMLMMVECMGAERNEAEWRNIFFEAGFKHYKMIPALGLRSIIEVYP